MLLRPHLSPGGTKWRNLLVAFVFLLAPPITGEVCNLRVITDASPDYSDLPSLLHSVASKWATPEEKCWALFYWNHIGRRQTDPMLLHGVELTDPIRQFNDYGYTMCSTISGINCALWHNLGLPARFWDISQHTVPEVFYEGRWHMYDNSMSALYTLCDGTTIAGVEDIGNEGACAASGGLVERGHIAKYHCLYASGPNGFLTGADTQRSLDEEAHCFNTNALKYRYYYFNWDYGHRYILNLKPSEVYTRYYHRLGNSADFFVPNHGHDPDDRYALRSNGTWIYEPNFASPDCLRQIHSASNIVAEQGGLQPAKAGQPAIVIFRIQGANVITSQRIKAAFSLGSKADAARLAVSTDNGLHWHEEWKSNATGETRAELNLEREINGAYEVLIRATLQAATLPANTRLLKFAAQTTTMLNAKTQPKLNWGRNMVYVGAGDQMESIVFWPELQGGKYKEHIVEEHNIGCKPNNPGFHGTLYPATSNEDAWLVYRLDAPSDIMRLNFGGRFLNRAPGSHVDLLYSTDAGQTWIKSWSLRRTTPPWDVVHYETVQLPRGHRSVWVKYLLNSREPAPAGCSIFAVRMEANYAPTDTSFRPIRVTFNWSERQADYSLVERSHTQTITRLPFKYAIDVGGEDHPIMNWLRINLEGAVPNAQDGYSDRKDSGGKKFIPNREICGHNLALGKTYTLSVPSGTSWGAGDPDGKKLTTGAGGPSYAGGSSYRSGVLWEPNANPIVTLDLGSRQTCASFGMNLHGYPWWDALKSQNKDQVEVRVSQDGQDYQPVGLLKMNLKWKDLPVNYMWTDDEIMTSGTFRFVPEKPIMARYVQYRITNRRIFACCGLEVLDSMRNEPFDLRVALPDEAGPITSVIPYDDGAFGSGVPDTTPKRGARENRSTKAE